jgi:hypothetical protein
MEDGKLMINQERSCGHTPLLGNLGGVQFDGHWRNAGRGPNTRVMTGNNME